VIIPEDWQISGASMMFSNGKEILLASAFGMIIAKEWWQHEGPAVVSSMRETSEVLRSTEYG
jgi:hypothetical protein